MDFIAVEPTINHQQNVETESKTDALKQMHRW